MDSEKALNIMKRMYILISCAKKQEKFTFHERDYKWRLGFNIILGLVENHYTLEQKIEKTTVFGVVAEIDFQNEDAIELWKNITNDVWKENYV